MNPLNERLRAGKPVVGCLITMPSVNMTQLLATSGLDFLFIDMEHAPIGIETVHAMVTATGGTGRSEEHTSELQSLMRISYAVFCLKKKNIKHLSMSNITQPRQQKRSC